MQKAALYSTNTNLYLNMAGVAESLGEKTKAENYYANKKHGATHVQTNGDANAVLRKKQQYW